MVAERLSYPGLINASWVTTGSMGTARYGHTATLLPDGKVLVADGRYGPFFLASAELYDTGITATHVDGLGAFDNQGNEVTFRFRATQAEDADLVFLTFAIPLPVSA